LGLVADLATAWGGKLLNEAGSASEPFPPAHETISVHLSIGIATTADSRRADELIRNADLAMYRAKETGKGRFEIFDLQMRDAVLKRHGLKEELQRAVEREEVVVEYQPIVELASGEVVAAEALVRWNHPGRGRLLPSEFVPLAEETGLIVALEGMARGSQENSFVRMIIDLARALDLRVVAEGIESAEELEALRDLECELGQGFYLAVPLDLTSDPSLPALGAGQTVGQS
jgi:predicted signal transduction protein with EAL and GGDEF domain